MSLLIIFAFVDEILWCCHLNDTSSSVFLHVTIRFLVCYKVKFRIYLKIQNCLLTWNLFVLRLLNGWKNTSRIAKKELHHFCVSPKKTAHKSLEMKLKLLYSLGELRCWICQVLTIFILVLGYLLFLAASERSIWIPCFWNLFVTVKSPSSKLSLQHFCQ